MTPFLKCKNWYLGIDNNAGVLDCYAYCLDGREYIFAGRDGLYKFRDKPDGIIRHEAFLFSKHVKNDFTERLWRLSCIYQDNLDFAFGIEFAQNVNTALKRATFLMPEQELLSLGLIQGWPFGHGPNWQMHQILLSGSGKNVPVLPRFRERLSALQDSVKTLVHLKRAEPRLLLVASLVADLKRIEETTVPPMRVDTVRDISRVLLEHPLLSPDKVQVPTVYIENAGKEPDCQKPQEKGGSEPPF